MRSLIHRVLVSILTIAVVYAFLPAQKVLADPLSLSSDALGNENYMVLQVLETAFVTINGGGETKSHGISVNDTNVAGACEIRDTIFVVGIAEGSTLITVYDNETKERCEFYVFVTASSVLDPPPVLDVATEGNTLTLSWSQVPGAYGYILYAGPFEPNPYRPYLTGIYSFDLGNINTLSGELPSGSAYCVMIQAHGAGGFSYFSNAVCFIIE